MLKNNSENAGDVDSKDTKLNVDSKKTSSPASTGSVLGTVYSTVRYCDIQYHDTVQFFGVDPS